MSEERDERDTERPSRMERGPDPSSTRPAGEGRAGAAPGERGEGAGGDPGGAEAPERGRLAVPMDRRGFFKATGALAVAAGLLGGCEQLPRERTGRASTPRPLVPDQARFPERAGPYEEVPLTPSEPPDPATLEFFSLHEARTVEALSATILPGSPDDPGAREAGVLNYIDHLLAHRHGFAEPIYREPPFAEPYRGDAPPADSPGGFRTVWVKAEELPRYGYQSSLTPREIYRRGIELVDRYSRENFGSDFVDLPEADQEAVVEAMAEGPGLFRQGSGGGAPSNQQSGAGGGQSSQRGSSADDSAYYPPSLQEFFEVLRSHTIEGFFADPLYGGNRDMVGWRMIGYPGAQRAYTPPEMNREGTDREPQSIAQLPHFNAGEPANDNVILPVSGSDRRGRH